MNYTYVDNGDDCGNDAAAVSDNENGHDYYNDNDEMTHKHHQQWCFKCLASDLPSVLFPEYNTAQIPLQLHNPSEHLHSRMLQFHGHFTYGGFEKSVCVFCVFTCVTLCVRFRQHADRAEPSRFRRGQQQLCHLWRQSHRETLWSLQL